MKIRNAIENLKCFPDWNVDDGWLTDNEMSALCDVAISALEKQVPKKLLKVSNEEFACSCGLIIQRKNRINCLYYCHNCGQAIDWSDEND